MTKDFIFLWLVFSGVLLGLTLLIGIYILLSRFFMWLRFTKNLKFVKDNLLNKVVEEKSMPVGDIIKQEDTNDVIDEFTQEIEQFKKELIGNTPPSSGDRFFFHPDERDMYTTVQHILNQQHYVQQGDMETLHKEIDNSMIEISSDIGSLKSDMTSHTQQLHQITATLEEIKNSMETVDKKIHDGIYHELKTFSVQLKSTVDTYIDKKVDHSFASLQKSQPSQSVNEDLVFFKLQQSLYKIQQQLQEKPVDTSSREEQHLQHTLLRQKISYMFMVIILCLIITLLVGFYFFRLM